MKNDVAQKEKTENKLDITVQKVYFCLFALAFLFRSSSFSLTLIDLSSASASKGFQSLFLTIDVNRSVSAGSFSRVSLNLFSASSSVHTRSKASSGQD